MLLEQRTVVVRSMTEVALKLERGDLNIDAPIEGAHAALTKMAMIITHAELELED
jgi:hypothetical protein